MITLRDVLESMDELESAPDNWDTAQRLAVLYVLRDHLSPPAVAEPEADVSRSAGLPMPEGDGEFPEAVRAADPEVVWEVLCELMDTLAAMQPRIFDAVMRRLRGG